MDRRRDAATGARSRSIRGPPRAPARARRGCGRRTRAARFNAPRIASKSGLRNSFHSVTTTQRVGTGDGVHRRRGVGEPRRVAEDALRFRHRDRIVGDDRSRRARRSAAMISRDGASRMSSVFGLNASPHSAKLRPARFSPSRATIFSTRRSFCASFAASTAPRIRSGRPSSGRGVLQRLHVLREARSAVADARDRGSASRSAGPSRCPGARARCRRRGRRRDWRARS